MKTLVLLTCGLALGAGSVFAQESAPRAPAASPAETTPRMLPPKPERPEPTGDLDAQLDAAKKRLAVLRMRHDEKHPLVQRQQRKVIELQKQARAGIAQKSAQSRSEQLDDARERLKELRERYTDEHPLVQNQLKRIAELEKS